MQDKFLVSVGIPAYNEEANITQIITQLLTQKQDNFELLEIIVVSDGSTDRTAPQVESIKDSRIKLLRKSVREGQSEAQNDIIKLFRGDALILLNADVYLPEVNFISKMVEPLISDSKIGIVCPKVVPLPAQNFFERMINNSVEMKTEMYEQINGGDNINLCHGRGRAFSKPFIVKLRFPKAVGEDAYSYIQCIEQGFSFYYDREIELLYRSPQNLRDHLNQSKRFFKSQTFWDSRYRRNNQSYYHIPKGLFIKTVFKYFLKHPIFLTTYVAVYSIAWINALWYQAGSLWEISQSSKSVLNAK